MKKLLFLLILIFPVFAFSQKAQIDLPITWNDSANVDYAVTDFGGNASLLTADPMDPSNLVLQSDKTSSAQTWAGTTLGTNSGFANAVPFVSGSTTVIARVYSPLSGIPVRLKVEDATDPTITVETEAMTTTANGWENLVFDFSNEVSGTAAINFASTYDKMSIFYNFGAAGATPSNVYYLDSVWFGSGSTGGGGPTKAQIDLPITWNDSANVDYTVTDFGGNASMLTADPMDPSNLVLQSDKTSSAQTWAGTTLGTNSGFANAVPFVSGSTTVTARIYSPLSGIPVRLKVEDANDPTITVETETMTTTSNAWENLVFDFSNEVSGTAAINFASTYDKMSIFYNFGAAGATPSNVYYVDSVWFSGGSSTGGGGGTNSSYCAASAKHLGIAAEVNSEIFLTIENTSSTTMKVTIESATVDSVDFLLVTNGTGASISGQDSSVAGQISRTLTWTTPPTNVDLNVLWSKDNFGGNWQLTATDISLPFNSSCSGSVPTKAQIDLPITWNDSANVDYTVTDFGGNASMLTADPMDPSNLVLQSDKTSSAQTWAGTTLGTNSGFANAVPFVSGSTTVTARVYSPLSGIPVRLKVEDANDPTITVETETMTATSNAWENLVFDFSNEVSGTAAINLASTYDKMSVFYNFGAAGATPSNVYYVDSVWFSGGSTGGGPTKAQIDLPITWNDSANVDYTVTDFGGNASMLTADPMDPSNLVLQSDKTSSAQTWAGTTLGTNSGFANAVPFVSGSTMVTARVYSPLSGIPVRLKVEDATDPTITVETEAMTTTANGWENLVFDFSNEVSGTAAINFASTYDKMSIFYNFGAAGATPSNVYYVDSVWFGSGSTGGGGPIKAQIDLTITWNDTANVDYTVTDFGGNASSVVSDPMSASNLVLKSVKTSSSQTWAGTTLSTNAGLANAIPFVSGSSSMSAVVYSPVSGIPVRLKVEDANDATISVETETMTTVANAWDTLVFDFSNQVSGTAAINYANTYDKVSIFYDFGAAGNTPADSFYVDDVFFGGGSTGGGGPTKAQIDLTITWDDTANVDYTVVDFGGNVSMLTADPTDPTNLVMQSDKTSSAQTWAGTTLSTNSGLANAVPFASGATTMTALVYSPLAGIPVRLKVEDATDPTITVETEALTTTANAWNTLTFDFANQAAGTAAINFASTYDKMSIFYNFGAAGATPSNVYYVDSIWFGSGSTGGGPTKAQIDLTITWDDTANVDYTVTDFGGNASSVVSDPMSASNLVLKSVKTSSSQTWAGTTLSTNAGLANAIPFVSGSSSMSAVVYSPVSGIPVRLKAEDANDATISVETETMTTVANAWDTLVFDFSNQVSGTAAINYANTYDKVSIFYDFGAAGNTPADSFYVDDVFFGGGSTGGGGPTKAQIDLTITWDDTANVDYTVVDFGGNVSMLTADPMDPTNLVMQSDKTSSAQTWAGTTLSTNSGLANAVPFASGATTMTALVYSPLAGIPVRLKVEDATDPTITVETEALTTTANAWNTLTFDFANQAAGTAAINFASTYDKMSIFYNFGAAGATPSNVYYVDSIWFGSGSTGGGGPTKAQIDLTITWDDTANVDYTVTDFGGNASALDVDPMNTSNPVLRTEKTTGAQTWAGTTLSTPSGLATAIPFAMGSTTVSAVVYSPVAGIPVRLKVEDHTDPTISVETEAMTTVANAWDTLTFDFANQATGTAAINFASTYDMMSIFYDFGDTGSVPGEVYYLDDVYFGGTPMSNTTNVTFRVDLSHYTANTYSEVNLNGTFNGWCGNCAKMLDPDNDSIFEITVGVSTGDTIEFKYTLDGWTIDEQLTAGDPCTKTAGGFTNRYLLPMADTILPAVCWESCSECIDSTFSVSENIWLNPLSVAPNPSNGEFKLSGELVTRSHIKIIVSNIQGQLVYEHDLDAQALDHTIVLNNVADGMYLVNVVADDSVLSEKILIRK